MERGGVQRHTRRTHGSLYPGGLEAWQPRTHASLWTTDLDSGFWMISASSACRVVLFAASPSLLSSRRKGIRGTGDPPEEPLLSCTPLITQPSHPPLGPCHLWNSVLSLFQPSLACLKDCLAFPTQRFPPPFKSKPLSSCLPSQKPTSTCPPSPTFPHSWARGLNW